MIFVGHIESLWRYPVKSMRGEQLQQAFVGFPGIYGDRTHAFCSSVAPPGFPWLTAREQQSMLLFRAAYRYPERTLRPVNLAEAETRGNGVTPVYAHWSEMALDVETPARERFAIDDPCLIRMLREGVHGHPDLKLLRSERALTDCRPVSLISLETVRGLDAQCGFELDKRRFRANLYLHLESGKAFGEDEFIGRTLQIGNRCVVRVLQRDTRCKMITLDPDTAQACPELMKLLARHHESKAGVYGAVLVEGIVQPGDAIALLD
jgi:uncharacterized protein YcbX